MKHPETVEVLKEFLKDLDARREALIKTIEMLEGDIKDFTLPLTGTPVKVTKVSSSPYSIQGRVVNATIELIHKLGRQATNTEILNNLKEKNISLGEGKDKGAALASILFQEVSKKNGRLRKVARGVYDLK